MNEHMAKKLILFMAFAFQLLNLPTAMGQFQADLRAQATDPRWQIQPDYGYYYSTYYRRNDDRGNPYETGRSGGETKCLPGYSAEPYGPNGEIACLAPLQGSRGRGGGDDNESNGCTRKFYQAGMQVAGGCLMLDPTKSRSAVTWTLPTGGRAPYRPVGPPRANSGY